MKSNPSFLVIAVVGLIATSPSMASVIDLYEWAVYVDGDLSQGSDPNEINAEGELGSNDLGTLRFTVEGAGQHAFILFLDYEIDESSNSFINEYGTKVGHTEIGQSWEIDEPGYIFGDIYQHVIDGELDNTNNVPERAPEDVSFALGWDFLLEEGEVGYIDMNISDILPDMSFYLQHSDNQSDSSIYFSSVLSIEQVPAPYTWLLLLGGSCALSFCRARGK
ncbi:hypothetical protein [Corallincola spongiicola]|uniref:PEP-CTERM sorting domain-containing protein n=1 Tax=Corallincola spongiicola TaxID=2520508 RepID=A0ABY1WM72_9GAMM|nr:hypothetical protein [Corallincola spongiicola]TAA42614.1 hypothetical protein EXY25_15090 [Corallincola spongiicola]